MAERVVTTTRTPSVSYQSQYGGVPVLQTWFAGNSKRLVSLGANGSESLPPSQFDSRTPTPPGVCSCAVFELLLIRPSRIAEFLWAPGNTTWRRPSCDQPRFESRRGLGRSNSRRQVCLSSRSLRSDSEAGQPVGRNPVLKVLAIRLWLIPERPPEFRAKAPGYRRHAP